MVKALFVKGPFHRLLLLYQFNALYNLEARREDYPAAVVATVKLRGPRPKYRLGVVAGLVARKEAGAIMVLPHIQCHASSSPCSLVMCSCRSIFLLPSYLFESVLTLDYDDNIVS